SDTVAVIGSEPEIYFYSGRRSATGYIYTYGLMEAQKYASTMQDEMIREIETARPKFVVLVNVSTSWLVSRESATKIFRWVDGPRDHRLDAAAPRHVRASIPRSGSRSSFRAPRFRSGSSPPACVCLDATASISIVVPRLRAGERRSRGGGAPDRPAPLPRADV